MDTFRVLMDVRRLLGFPDRVDETSARIVAAGVAAQAVVFLVVGEGWLLAPLVYGFVARVLSGPTLSPLGQLAVRGVTPFLHDRLAVRPRPVPGPPKRFAQVIGLVFTAGAAIGWAIGATWTTYALLAGLLVAASLEAFAGVCLGCIAHSAIWGCDDCGDIGARLREATIRSRRPVSGDDREPVATG